jgi:hypothetical protein
MTISEKYQCCFCGTTIDPVSPDVGGLLYYTCADRGKGFQSDQQLFCHTRCLTERVHQSVHLYVLDLLNFRASEQ